MSDEGVQHAAAALDAGRPAVALTLIGRHLAQFPDDASAHYVASEALRRLGRGQEAVAAAVDAVRLDPQNMHCWSALAFAQREVGDLPNAVASATRATQLAPADWATHVNLATLAGEHDPWSPLAVQAAQEAVRLAPNESETHQAMGVGMLRRNQTKDAMDSLRMALRLDPHNKLARHNMAIASMRSGDPAGAAVDLAGLTAQSPNDHLTSDNFRIAIGKSVAQIHFVALAGALIPLQLLRIVGGSMSTGSARLLLGGLVIVTLGIIASLIVRARRTLGPSLAPIFQFVVARDRLIAAWAAVDTLALIPLTASPLLPSAGWSLSYGIAGLLLFAGLIFWVIRGRMMFLEAKKR